MLQNSDNTMLEGTGTPKSARFKPNFRAHTHLVFFILARGCLLLVDEVLLDHLLLELADDGVDARPLLVVRLQPPQPLRVLGQCSLLAYGVWAQS